METLAKKKRRSTPSKPGRSLPKDSEIRGNSGQSDRVCSTQTHLGTPALGDSMSLEDACAEVTNQPRTQLAREIVENLRRFPHCLLLTRVGQFYEVIITARLGRYKLTIESNLSRISIKPSKSQNY